MRLCFRSHLRARIKPTIIILLAKMVLIQIQKLLTQVIIRQSYTITSRKRLYGRWTHRTPSRVLMPFKDSELKTEKIIELDAQSLKEAKIKHVEKIKSPKIKSDGKTTPNTCDNLNEIHTRSQSKFSSEKLAEIKDRREIRDKKRLENLSKEKVFDENNQIIYEKLKENDGRLSTLLVQLKSKKGRTKTGAILVEGWRMIMDGLEAKCPLRYLIFSNTEDLNNLRPFLPKTGVKIYKIPYKEIQLWSDVETSPGIMGIFQTPSVDNIIRNRNPLPINIICDNIRIPGNMGAVLRAAVGVGCDKMLLTKGCVDLWDPKVLRSAAGAHFRLPVQCGVDWEQLSSLLDSNTSIFIADNNSKVMLRDDMDDSMDSHVEYLQIPVLPYYSIEYATLSSITVVVGGETEGISEECYRFAASRNGLRINIPLQKGVDSLNTGMATAVIIFEIKKQLLQANARKSNLMAQTV